jgi:anti-anti-sigma factor
MTHLDLETAGSVEQTEITPGVHVLALHGYADERLAPVLESVLLPLAASDGSTIVLDLEDAVGIDEALLSVVARAAHSSFRRGERLGIITRSHNVSELVRESGLADIVSVQPSLREAVRHD